MNISAKLALAFGAVVGTFAVAGMLIFWNLALLRSADAHVRERVSFNELALEYRHGAQEASLGAAQLASGNAMGEQRLREGTASMKSSRLLLAARSSNAAGRSEVLELERVEKLTIAATLRLAALVRSKSPQLLIDQELAFLSARADALNLRLEALFDETRDEVDTTMALADAIGTRVQAETGYALLVCVLFSVAVAMLVFRSIAGPLARLDDGVRRIGAGNLDYLIPVTSKDEVGKLTRAFNDMTVSLRSAMSALDGRNRDMRLVLDHVNQGLLTMTREGVVSGERSAITDKWLGPVPAQTTLWGHLQARDALFADTLQNSWEQVIDDFLPLELTLGQMPKVAVVSERHLEFEYMPIWEGARIDKLLVVISDVSERLARERDRAHQEDVLRIFQAVQRDKQGFVDFFAEGTALVSALTRVDANTDFVVLKRQIHTLKGNSAVFGIMSVAKTCHELETRMAENATKHVELEELEQLRVRWGELTAIVLKLLGDDALRIEIDDDEFVGILDALVKGRARREIVRMVAAWRVERVQTRLNFFAEQARELAARLNKAPLLVNVESNGLRLPRGTFANFWMNLSHAIRNALDHGIEPAAERVQHGKSGPGTLTLSTRLIDDELAIEVADNGRGIDWPRIAAKAKEHQLPANTPEELVQALFFDGLSTASAVSDVSGRGVGMAALRDACAHLGGRIVIQSTPDEGTRMSFLFPRQLMFDETVVELTTRPIANSLPPGQRGSVPVPSEAEARIRALV
jgi:two-component system, chemotaxis family, sensor kinase CheA